MTKSKVIYQWQKKLERASDDLKYMINYLENPPHELSRSEKEFIRSEVESKQKYIELLESTIEIIQKSGGLDAH